MKKITLFFMSLFFAMTAWAAATDLPEMSTEDNIQWYTIKNVRQQKYATYAGENATMTQQETISGASLFYFTASTTEGAVKIHNYSAGNKLCAAYNSWTADGIDWYLKAQSTGVSICTSTGEWNAWNDASGGGQKVEYWSASDAGSAWEIELVTDFTAAIDVPAAKTAAIAELNNLATVSVIYPAATTEAVAAIEAVTAADNTIAGLNAAIGAINQIVADYKTAAYKALSGKYYTINTPARDNGYLQMTASKVVGTAAATTPANLWQFVENNGAVNIYNPYTGLYMCATAGKSAAVNVTDNQENAGAYTFTINNTNPANENAKVKIGVNGANIHVDGSSNLVRWDDGDASEFTVTLIDDNTITTIVTEFFPTVKAAAIAELNNLATVSVIYPAATTEAVAAIEAVTAADNTIAGLNAATEAINEIVADYKTAAYKALSGKYYTINTPARDNGYLQMTASKVVGTASAATPANIWQFVENNGAVNIYNPYTGLYMCATAGNSEAVNVTDNQENAGAYTLTINNTNPANENAKVKIGVNGANVHVDGSSNLVRWDDGDASEFTVTLIDDNTVATIVTEFISPIKAAAVEEVEAWAQIANLFPAKDEYVTRINTITATTIAGCKEAVAAINAVIPDYIKNVDGKSVRFTSYGRDNANGHDLVIEADGGYGKTNAGEAGIWTLKAAGTQVKLYNFIADLWLGKTSGGSQRVPAVQTEAEAMTYTFSYNTSSTEDSIIVNLINAGNTLHLDAGKKVVQWNDNAEPASQFLVNAEAAIVPTRELYVAANNSAAKLPYEMQKAYGLVKDTANYYSNHKEPTEGSYEALLDNNAGTIFHSTWSDSTVLAQTHYIQADFGEGNAVGGFYFYMAPRSNGKNFPVKMTVSGSNDNQDFETIAQLEETTGFSTVIGDDTKQYQYIRLTVDSTNTADNNFFALSELYFFPATEEVTALINKCDNFAEAGITDAGYENLANKLINAEVALSLSNSQADAETFISSIDHAKVPALGQYPTAAYNELVAAVENATTKEEVVAAINTFKLTLNRPVYIIKSAWEKNGEADAYTKGGAILFDGKWKWAAADKTNKQMWMTFPGLTTTEVPVVDAYDAEGTSYEICDYLTGTLMRGKMVQIVKIADWENAYNLQYNADATSTDAAHHAQSDGKALVNWKAATANENQASAWTFEYVGNSYDLSLPLEVVNVTPSEPVTSLQDIVIEYSEDIAGEFDSMAMYQIYLGTKSNGASFTVEGNKLNITLFYPIETPGEYALKIPAGLITRVSNGEDVTCDGEIKFTVVLPPLEVVSVTPSGPVTSLQDIVIEYSEDIAGEFDIMAMDQIYLGTRSNGASFTVEGNKLNITLFYPIETPGEYALKIPAGLITRVSNGEDVTCNGEIKFIVSTPTEIENVIVDGDAVIYDLSGRRVEKITERGIYIVNGKKVIK